MKKCKRIGLLVCVLMMIAPALLGCNAQAKTSSWTENKETIDEKFLYSMPLLYAENFCVDYYEGGYTLISISNGGSFLVVPSGKQPPKGVSEKTVVLTQPMENIYLVATSAMCLFDALGELPAVRLTGTKAKDWYVENARAAMEKGDMLYAGKYNTPDFELILDQGCTLAIESTMINHTPEVKEKLEALGIPVLIEQSSYEPHPLGRLEWMKLYAALTGKEAEAEKLFNEQVEYMKSAAEQENTGKTIAFFYVASNGSIVARKSGDYITKMIELAGGNYVFDDLGDPEKATSTITLEMEQFYATAKDADYIIYNSAIDGTLNTMDDLIAKNEMFKDFKAVQNGNVWCTDKNLFQQTTQIGLMISDMREMLTSEQSLDKLHYMYRLKK